jgi:murein tripeptide amidase MpaA
MLQGLIDFLTGPSELARMLRSQFVFKVVPMLNIDGVVNGSNRCNLAGVDLNRQWSDPSRRLHPTIFATKSLIRRFIDEREVVLFCDFHAHSRKKNVFMYGNNGAKNTENGFR